MKARRLITIAVVALFVIGGAAALGAASPADQANNEAMDVDGEDVPEEDRGDADAAEDRSEKADGAGPSDSVPEHVPDHVSTIQDRIGSFLDGSIDQLGQTLSELLGDNTDGASDENNPDDESVDEGVDGDTPSTT